MSNPIELLRDDANYYGEFGSKYLSNSDIDALLNDPRQFKAKKKDNINFHVGRLFHQQMLEPEKAKDFPYVSASSRMTNIYKDYIKENNVEFAMLEKEYNDTISMCKYARSDLFFFENVIGREGVNEQPGIMDIHGVPFKAKADRIVSDAVIDIKSTSDISKFRSSAYKYNYDSQAYIYQTIFKKPMIFFVVEKTRKEDFRGTFYHRMRVFTCSDEFVASGQDKVARAVDVYKTYFSKEKTKDIEDYFINLTL